MPDNAKNKRGLISGDLSRNSDSLRKLIREEIWAQLFQGMIFFGLGTLVLLVTTFVSLFFSFFILLHLQALLQLGNSTVIIARYWLAWILTLVVVVASFYGEYRRTSEWIDGLERIGILDEISPSFLIGLVKIIVESFEGGPRLIFSGMASFRKVFILRKIDVETALNVLGWIRRKNRKVSISELASNFRNIDILSVLVQLKELSGVVWLSSPRGFIILTEPMKSAVDDAALADDEESTDHDFTEDFQSYPAMDDKIALAYQALRLPIISDLEAVKKQYRRLAKVYHPDKSSHLNAEQKLRNEDRMKAINQAYHTILSLHK